MTQIDRYVLFLYIRVFFICFMTLGGLLVVVQLFTNVEEFVNFGNKRGGLFLGLLEYFGPQMLSLFDRMCGLITLLATMFVMAWLSRTHELTAILAAGISKGRVIRPILVASIIVIVVAATMRETVIPFYSSILSKTPQDLAGESVQPLRPADDFEQGFVIVGKHLIVSKRTIVQPVFKFSGPVTSITRQILGELAEYQDADANHPAGYLLKNFLSSDSISDSKSVSTPEGIFLYMPIDNPWLARNDCFIPSKLEFEMLSGGGSKLYASTYDLIWRLQNQNQYYGSDLKVNVHARLVQPFLDFTQLLIGLPLILSNHSRNLVRMIAACVLTYGLFFGLSIGFRTLGANETLLTPAASVWAPLILFAPVAWSQSVKAMQS